VRSRPRHLVDRQVFDHEIGFAGQRVSAQVQAGKTPANA